MYRGAALEGSLSTQSSTRRPVASKRANNPQVLSVSSQTTYKGVSLRLQPPTTTSAGRAAPTSTSSQPLAVPSTTCKSGLVSEEQLPRLVKGSAPFSSARRRSQPGFIGSTACGGEGSTAGTTGAALTPTMTSKSQQWRVGAPGMSAVASACPLTLTSRRGSQAGGSAAAGVSSSAVSERGAGAEPGMNQQRTLAGSASSSVKATPKHASSKVKGTTKAANGLPSIPTNTASSGTVASPTAYLPAFSRTDAVAAPLLPFKSASANTIDDSDDGSNTMNAEGAAAAGACGGAASGDCGVSERITPVAASSINTVLVSSSPTPLSVFWNLTSFEEEEIREYLPEVYFTGNISASEKVQGIWSAKDIDGGGYDDENCHYRVVTGDHIAYRYEITKELGRGTFGVVVSAIDHKIPSGTGCNHNATDGTLSMCDDDGSSCGGMPKGRRVAIKLIKNKPAYTKQAKEEARLLHTLVSNDPNDEANIVRLLDTFTFRNHYVLVFELLQSDLYSYMQTNNYRPFKQRFVFRFADSMLRALEYLSEHGIVHCDVKPENIVVDDSSSDAIHTISTHENSSTSIHSGNESSLYKKLTSALSPSSPRHVRSTNDPAFRRFKLIDFGSSCTLDKRVFTYIQSRYYRAPEIILGIPYTPAIDMWSFGCVLCELANGMPIFPACCEGELLERMTEYLGPVPGYLIAKGKRSDKFFAPSNPLSRDVSSGLNNSAPERSMLPGLSKKGRKRKAPGSRTVYAFLAYVREKNGRDEAHLFHDFVMRCLTYDPEQRMTASEALQHPWMQKWRAVLRG